MNTTIFTNLSRYRHELRAGFFSAVYFNRTKQITETIDKNRQVTMQIFQRNDHATLFGIQECLDLFSIAAGWFTDRKKAEVLFKQYQLNPSLQIEQQLDGLWQSAKKEMQIVCLPDKSVISANEPVMHITGPYSAFAHLESIYLGILARRTMIATNTANCKKAAGTKQLLFFADRFDYFLNQPGDGYSALQNGCSAVCTDAMGSLSHKLGMGTIPHALIAFNNGDTLKAAEQFSQTYPEIPLIILVDYANNSVKTALELAKHMGKKLWGIRLDTAATMTDVSCQQATNSQAHTGVHPHLVKTVRQALNHQGYKDIHIIVSGGFTAERIQQFEQEHTPVDAYGIGSSLLKGNFDFTADIVKVNEKKQAKSGREYRENPRFQT